MNLLEETLYRLSRNDKTWDDVMFVRCGLATFTPEQAKPMLDFEYDNGYGHQEVDDSLLIVGRDWWMERHEYDGSEWWEFKCMPKKTDVTDYKFKTFKSRDWRKPEEYDDYIGA